jgi:H+/gluconate symporter-like permease
MGFLTSVPSSLVVFIIGLALFVVLCFTKVPRIFSVVLCSLIFAFGIADTFLNTIFTTLLEGAVSVIKSYLMASLSGALVGCAMSATGCANALANAILKLVGKKRGLLAVQLVAAIVCASGALGHTFIVLPIALAIARECNYSRGIAMMLYVSQVQIIQWSLVGIPGLPNLLPAEILGCTIYEHPIMSITGCLVAEILIYFIALAFERNDKKHNKGFELTPEVNVFKTPDVIPEDQLPSVWFSLLPMIFMIGGSLLLSNLGMASTPAAVCSQVFTVIFLVITRRNHWVSTMPGVKSKMEELGQSMMNIVPMIIITGFIGGMGTVISSMVWYEPGIEWALGLNMSPYLLAFVVVAIICFITSDGIAGMQMFLSTMGERFMSIPGINIGALHRVITSTACTVESMPWTAGCYNYNAYYGLSVKTGWKYHFIGTVGITTFLAVFFVVWSSIAWPC